MSPHRVIAMPLYNRPAYAKDVLEALAQCTGVERYTIVACVEPGNDEVRALVESIDFAECMPVFNAQKMGPNANIFQSLSRAFELTEYVVYLEEDILPSQDALLFFEFCGDRYRDDRRVLSVTGYHRASRCDPKSYYEVRRRHWFHGWGCALWKDRWRLVAPGWPGPQGVVWDTHVNDRVRHAHGLCEVHPLLSRVQNIGAENGAFVPSAEWHRKHQHVPLWAGNLQMPPGAFWEGGTRDEGRN